MTTSAALAAGSRWVGPFCPESDRVTVRLSHGVLDVTVTRADLPLDALMGFASRRNPRRPFLFVSKVLGRHLPSSPAVMQETHRRLATALGDTLPGPVMMLGMAETAVGLGQGVFEAWQAASGRDDALYLASTRYHLSRPLLLTFQESHSHATDHRVYRPDQASGGDLLAHARTLVLIDDEVSTGATFAALIAASRQVLPALDQVVMVTLTDWMGEERRAAFAAHAGVPVRFVSLLEGGFRFTPTGEAPPVLPNVVGSGTLKDHLLPPWGARLGERGPRALPPSAAGARVRPGERVLVLGTGEFVHPPFQLARALAAQGGDVVMQATTRSPILPGHAIGAALEFPDAYQDGIPNYLYGVSPDQYDRILVCYETPPATAQQSLIDALGAQPVYFANHDEEGRACNA
ncbi:phosphoribosyltransferase family protein [Pararhodospirillum oryzae]|uniref:Phosphoribosyltransferase n=1 Tax=Pararhodospirillum oryzae TaxID=478448 RepID=A0A512HBN7_9PROT|nr:phosphoribosyltransferase family protein [Pararhodospirillum oryzae]GEO82858.1 hypothetical protein ROR02_29890 [Pararhodospirillum oryzae]